MDFPLTSDREAHMIAVARYMYKSAPDYGLNPERMYVLGLLHDIGYLSGEKKGHEKYGAKLMKKLGYKDFKAIKCHGTTPKEYLEAHPLDKDDDIPLELALLWDADMMINGKGQEVGYMSRLNEIAEKYGNDSDAYKMCRDTVEWLMARNAFSKRGIFEV